MDPHTHRLPKCRDLLSQIDSRAQFVDRLLNSGTPRVVTDPDPDNGRAVRAYEKAGFEKDRMVDSPDGAALLRVRNP